MSNYFVTVMDCNPPSSSVHGIFQARILEGLLFLSSADLNNPGTEPKSPVWQANSLPLRQLGSSLLLIDKDIITLFKHVSTSYIY